MNRDELPYSRSLYDLLTTTADCAKVQGYSFQTTSHLTTAISLTPECEAFEILTSLGVDPILLVQQISEAEVKPGEAKLPKATSPVITPRISQVMSIARSVAHEQGADSINTAHILVAIMRTGNNATHANLKRQGITVDKLIAATAVMA